MTIAAGGAGKSTLAIAEALSMVRGFPLLGDETTEHPEIFARVWIYNGEDDRDELTRRIMAACLHYKITPTELNGRLFVDTGCERQLITHRQVGLEIKVAVPMIEAVKRQIVENQIDVLIVDPFVSTHTVPENDNGAINEVASQWRQIAEECNCSIELIHHTKKTEGRSVTVADARGGSALVNVARSVRELNNMTYAQAKAAGVSAEERNTIKALTFGKTNLSATPASTRWKVIIPVPLSNEGALNEGQDHVGVMTEWNWPDAEQAADDLPADKVEAIMSRLAGGLYGKAIEAADWAGHVVGEYLELGTEKGDPGRPRVCAILAAWEKSGKLEVYIERTTPSAKARKYLRPAAG